MRPQRHVGAVARFDDASCTTDREKQVDDAGLAHEAFVLKRGHEEEDLELEMKEAEDKKAKEQTGIIPKANEWQNLGSMEEQATQDRSYQTVFVEFIEASEADAKVDGRKSGENLVCKGHSVNDMHISQVGKRIERASTPLKFASQLSVERSNLVRKSYVLSA